MRITTQSFDTLKDLDIYTIGLFEGEDLSEKHQLVDAACNGQLSYALKEDSFKAKLNKKMLLYTSGSTVFKRLLVIGLGKRDEYTTDKCRQVAATAVKELISLKKENVASEYLGGPALGKDFVNVLVEGFGMGAYTFNHYKSKDEENPEFVLEHIILSCKHDIQSSIKKGLTTAKAVNTARDLGNHPGNVATPTYLANAASEIAKAPNFKLTIFNREDFEKMGFGGIKGVSDGSDEPPKFIIMHYTGDEKDGKTLGLVGKGLTFDSGGISIKPPASMDEMKFDMLGGAAVLGIMQAVATMQPKLNIVAIVPSTENLLGAKAYKPGDILKAYNGKTIEVLNTDAEGRLILADALSYLTENFKVDGLVDFATLTGAVVVGLGHRYSAVISNNQDFADEIKSVSDFTHDKVWQLPLDEDFTEDIKSKIADFKNTGNGRAAGAITAGAFLQEFVKKGTPWCHIDIAGSGWNKSGKSYNPDGPTGVGVRLILELIDRWKKE